MTLSDHYVDNYQESDEDYMFSDDYYYPYLMETEDTGAFEDGCLDLLEKIYNIRQYQDLGPVDRAILEIIEELVELL